MEHSPLRPAHALRQRLLVHWPIPAAHVAEGTPSGILCDIPINKGVDNNASKYIWGCVSCLRARRRARDGEHTSYYVTHVSL